MKEDNSHDKKPLYVHYHTFTDKNDDWFRTMCEATKCINIWKSQGNTNLRIYEVGVYADEHGETYENEGCYVYGEGQFPL